MTSDHVQVKIKMPNVGHESPASSKAPNQDFKDMDVLCTIKTKIMISNPSQEPPVSSKAPNQDFKDIDVL